MTLSQEEIQRYTRHFALPHIGIKGQQKLKAARVLCVGVGGLGSPCTLYLTAAGVGTLGIIDPDQVELSNLHRQILYTEADQGQSKVEIAKKRLLALNPHMTLETYPEFLSTDNALSTIEKYDIVVDGTDNIPTRLLVNDACVHLKKPNVYASIFQFQGQLSIFSTKEGPCYRCLYPATPSSVEFLPTCAESGVLGALPGIMGSLQAAEVIKWIVGSGTLLIGRLLTLDILTMHFKEFTIKKNVHCELCSGKKDFYSIARPKHHGSLPSHNDVKEISSQELHTLRTNKEDFILLDVRQPNEYEMCHLDSILIPLPELPDRLNELDKKKLIIVHCKSGARGEKAVRLLRANGFHAKNLIGGILAWSREMDAVSHH